MDNDGEYFFVMKQVEGETLEDIITKLRAGDADYHKRYGFERRLQLFIGILEAINFARSSGSPSSTPLSLAECSSKGRRIFSPTVRH